MNPYERLGVAPDADLGTLRSARRALEDALARVEARDDISLTAYDDMGDRAAIARRSQQLKEILGDGGGPILTSREELRRRLIALGETGILVDSSPLLAALLATCHSLQVREDQLCVDHLNVANRVDSAIDMFGRIRHPGGRWQVIRSAELLVAPDSPDTMTTGRTVAFFLDPADVNISVVETQLPDV